TFADLSSSTAHIPKDSTTPGGQYGLDYHAYAIDVALNLGSNSRLVGQLTHQQRSEAFSNGAEGQFAIDVVGGPRRLEALLGSSWLQETGLPVISLGSTAVGDLAGNPAFNVPSATTYWTGLRWHLATSATIGVIYFYGQPLYPHGNLVASAGLQF
ncbi:MAG: hypothetical protein KGR26_03295, partial [Cyanobacteria bacterium REEB65]|nr:hypothetical protein [Cyanobacteria bacterium REEB65]